MPADRLPSGPVRRQGRRPTPPERAVTRRRAGEASRRGRTIALEGPFVLAEGLAAPGAIPIAEAAEIVVVELARQSTLGLVGKDTAYGTGSVGRQFAAYAAARGVTLLADVDQDLVEMFVHSPHGRGPGGAPEPVAVGTKHSRRSALRSMFKTCRAQGLDDRDPAADIVLPPRLERVPRPLTDDEMQRCQDASFRDDGDAAAVRARPGDVGRGAERGGADDRR